MSLRVVGDRQVLLLLTLCNISAIDYYTIRLCKKMLTDTSEITISDIIFISKKSKGPSQHSDSFSPIAWGAKTHRSTMSVQTLNASLQNVDFCWKSSTTLSKISGADEPSAISVRFAMVSFHTYLSSEIHCGVLSGGMPYKYVHIRSLGFRVWRY